MNQVDQTIKSTNEYSLFQRINGNRKISQAHINKLVEAIKGDVSCITYNPILVNEKFEVIDGQHRLEAIKQLELPVFYIQEKGLKLNNVQALNSKTKPWTPMDYAKSFSELGIKEYQTYIEFKLKYKLNHDVLINFLSLSQPMTGESFKNGKLRIEDEERSHDICNKLLDFSVHYERYRYRSFAFAFKIMWSNENYDHTRMLNKLESGHKIEDFVNTNDYLRLLETIYNHGLPTQKKQRFY